MSTLNRMAVLGFAATILFISGCGGDGIDRCVVFGNVTYQGQAVLNGEIRFVPEQGPISGGPIVEGKYRIKHQGGVPLGKHTVKITAYTLDENDQRIAERDIAEVGGGTEFQFIPAKFNEESELTAEVTGEADPQELDFDL